MKKFAFIIFVAIAMAFVSNQLVSAANNRVVNNSLASTSIVETNQDTVKGKKAKKQKKGKACTGNQKGKGCCKKK